VQERGQERPVRAGQPRPLDRALQDGELVAQRQDLDILPVPLAGSNLITVNTLDTAR
jgi:hypothetical protein